MTKPSRFIALSALCVALASGSCVDTTAQGGAAAPQPVVREILGQIESPPGAQGRLLTLVRYTIAPGADIAPHVHPGVQMASIESGTLTYRVVSGTATVHRQVNSSGVPSRIEKLAGPADLALRAGDVVIEDASMIHVGANRTSEPVVILSTLITELGAELAVPMSPAAD